ncbi:DNA phosphorothioation-associated putative methyltransferase [Jiangella alkaliphila]|uniref:DNA phosphorothioation-associated putative methyltransferase n=1 Tax=Jiangella alkaliphila TaxID=419479 RepID=A0A1H2IWJ6_9ACTN|nr:DNA phosphorothioation-associated putative methyltransferase [Jiangella alkaliphila]SDU48198.1 DNA phosphorothioation-associated putative methyltransferase [Jiangella alkaliphila]
MEVARHRTAMTRSDLSRPISTALVDGLLDPAQSIFDYGCGRGDDVRSLRDLGYAADGWDPNHNPEVTRTPAEVVNLGYVVNVIEHPTERADTLRSAWKLARRLLIVSARLTWEARDLIGVPHADGMITRAGTFQRFYDQNELAIWIEDTIGVRPLAAAPGIFYVFRDPVDAQQFLATRVYTYRPRVHVDPHQTYEAHRELLAPLFAFVTEHARPPRPGELGDSTEDTVRQVFGSLSRGHRLIRQVTDDAHWDRVSVQRRAELLIYVALSRFGGRPRLGELPTPLARDIRALFGTYRKACTQADRLLLACGDPAIVLVTARSSKIGKQTPSALYVHRSALAELPPVLQVYEGCARALAGTVVQANMIKLSVAQPQVSYLSYPSFDHDAHPTLDTAITVNLRRLTVEHRGYGRSANPPLLHRKEEFLGLDHPRRALYERLTRAEQRAGLYRAPERIGTLVGWLTTLEESGYEVRGHRLQRMAGSL